jgi:hypothetical protein
MPVDAQDLSLFYEEPVGQAALRLIGLRLKLE